MRWLPRTWNDILAVLLLVGLPLYWWLAQPSGAIEGATLAVFTLVAQYFFRRAPPSEETRAGP